MNFDVLGDYLAENSQLYNSDLPITIELKGCMMGIIPIDRFAVNLSNYRKNTFV